MGKYSLERRIYPSDVTDEEWEILEPLLPAAKPGGRPQEIERREIVNGILYVLRSGCPWRMLPHDLPNWSTVYLELPRIWGVGEEKSGRIRSGGFDGQNATDLHQRIEAISCSTV